MQPDQLLILFFVSLLANWLSALAGGGAGLLQLPALLLMGLPFGQALATHKVASVALGLGAGYRHWRQGGISPGLSIRILAAGLPGVWVGAHLILRAPEQDAEFALGALTLGLGAYSIARKDLGLAGRTVVLSGVRAFRAYLGLFLIGILNGSLTSGTGLFVTLWLIRAFGMDFSRAVAYTLILVGVFWNGTGAITLGLQAPIRIDWMPSLLLGSLLGGYLGAHMAILKGNALVKRAFEGLAVLVGAHLLYDSVRHWFS